MIEVIYKDEKQTTRGTEGNFNLPKNIRQIGLPGEEYRIYIEDYVYTFLKKTAEKKEEKGSVAVFAGEIKWADGKEYLFVKGAVLLETRECTEEHVEIEDAAWQKLHEEMEKYFPGQEIAGWFMTGKGLTMEVSENLQRIHLKYFGGEKVLMLMEPVESEEAFFLYENGQMVRQNGYYIYYEKNPCMQTYMLEKNPELGQSEQENVSDDAVRAFRKILQKKHTEESEETEERTSVFSYAATACLVLAVMTIGVQFYQNYSHKNVKDTLDTVTETASNAVKTEKNTEKEKKVVVTPTSAIKKDPTTMPSSPASTVTPAVLQKEEHVMQEKTENERNDENSSAEKKEEEIYRAESDSRKAERRMRQQEKADGSGETTAESTAASTDIQGKSYVIKPGDTLYQISISQYGTMEKVQEICRTNGLTEDEIIYPGQIIVLP